MNATLKRTLLASLTAFALLGAGAAARAADDMGGMKMGDSKPAPEKKQAKDEMPKEQAKKGTEKLEVAVTDKGFEPDKLEVMKGKPVEIVFTRKTDQTCIKEVILDTGANEQCDDGGANSNAPGAACRPACQFRRCGDGIVDGLSFGEACETRS